MDIKSIRLQEMKRVFARHLSHILNNYFKDKDVQPALYRQFLITATCAHLQLEIYLFNLIYNVQHCSPMVPSKSECLRREELNESAL